MSTPRLSSVVTGRVSVHVTRSFAGSRGAEAAPPTTAPTAIGHANPRVPSDRPTSTASSAACPMRRPHPVHEQGR